VTGVSRRSAILAVGAALVTCGAARAGQIDLRANGMAEVLRFDIGPEGRFATAPLLVIQAGGAVWVRPIAPGAARVQGRMAVADLRALIGYIVDTEGLLTITEADLAARIAQATAAGGPMFRMADAATTEIALTLQGTRHGVAFHGLAFAAQLFPGIEAVQRLRRIELHLLRVAEGLRGG